MGASPVNDEVTNMRSNSTVTTFLSQTDAFAAIQQLPARVLAEALASADDLGNDAPRDDDGQEYGEPEWESDFVSRVLYALRAAELPSDATVYGRRGTLKPWLTLLGEPDVIRDGIAWWASVPRSAVVCADDDAAGALPARVSVLARMYQPGELDSTPLRPWVFDCVLPAIRGRAPRI